MLTPHQLQLIVNQLQQALLVIDTKGIITLTNSRLDSFFGLPSATLQGYSLYSLIEKGSYTQLGFDADGLRMLLYQLETGDWSAQNTGGEYQLEQPYPRYIQRSHIPLQDEGGQLTGLLLLFTDITDTHDLYQAQGQIVSMIVHDLRSPLSAITSSMRLLQDIADPHSDWGQMVLKTTDISGRAARKLLNLVSSLLDVSKMENGLANLEREPADLDDLLKSVIAELRPLADEMDVQIQVTGAEKLPSLDIEADKIERVFYNLVDNAIKFSPADGTVVIAVQHPQNGFVRVDVRDNGIGIPEEYKTKLFNRFQQVEETVARRRGTGLGLTFCKLTVEAHGGKIWIEDNPEGGSIFAFTLPVTH